MGGFLSQWFKLGNEHVDLSWDKGEVMESIFCPFPGFCILEGFLEAPRDFCPEMFISGSLPVLSSLMVQLVQHLTQSFMLDPLMNPRKRAVLFMGSNLFHIYIGHVVEAEFVHKGISFGPVTIEF